MIRATSSGLIPAKTALLAGPDQTAVLQYLAEQIALQELQYPDERTAVIWNGELLAIDALRLSRASLQTVLAGCACCLGGPVLKATVAKVLKATQPRHLWIVGGPGALLRGLAQAIQSPMLAQHCCIEQLIWIASNDLSEADAFDQSESATLVVNPHLVNIVAATHPWAGTTEPHFRSVACIDHRWPQDALFDRKALQCVFKSINEVVTIKSSIDGVFRTQRTHYYGATSGINQVWRETSWCLDSRLRIASLGHEIKVLTNQNIIERFEACRMQ